MAVFNPHVACLCAAEGGQIGSAAKGLADVAGQRANVGSLSADHPDAHLHLLGVEAGQFYLIDAHTLGLQFHGFSLSHQFVGPVAFHHTGAVGRRYLVYFAGELLQHLFYFLTRDLGGRIFLVYRMLHIEAWRGGTQLQRCRVFLGVFLQFFNLLGGPARTEYQHACCQRVKCSGMSNLHFITQVLGKHVAYMCQCAETRHPIGLVDAQDNTFLEIHQSTIESECPVKMRTRMITPTMIR